MREIFLILPEFCEDKMFGTHEEYETQYCTGAHYAMPVRVNY